MKTQLGCSNGPALRILLVQAENLRWRQARSYPYCLNFAFEDGLRANGIECLMVTTPWISRIRDICGEKQFDQVWINDLSHFCDFNISLEEIIDLAPIRVGFVTESVDYYQDEYEAFPWLRERRARIDKQFKYVTHIAAVDEQDVLNLKQRFDKPTMWLPCSMPEGYIYEQVSTPAKKMALFSGSVYGKRVNWLKEPKLKTMLAYQKSPNSRLVDATLFNLLPGHRFGRWMNNRLFPAHHIYPVYLDWLRQLRRKAHTLWLQGMQAGAAVVNLPHLVKGYSSRVIEGLASGRPVISWEIPDRPKNTALFEDGHEILLYSTPEQLATQIERVLSDPDFGERIAQNARNKVRRFHTTEKRVQQIVHWVGATDEAQDYRY
ncbi:hypothetical protein PN36_11480 [Candidatus Thiomargarita nelsonii]|uniref:Spore protein YkvP/CgeB glycosyl transferase-like domain-containing protein n=1 Tax=Candidatus Thiomargarita nelsonii TaxID=1003181 RepID=A0A0A6RQ04_9GAMM|nr:hypothetical protein PN36_11480 [Candidatus Thiomargarita nelsonii]